ncbi:MAG: type II toxin-antitoxin system VapC family toxin [Treponemataceae bacterium]|jgi:PIN domain nuclease of toxin-antitoxin system|nr:type II toxin-antitoxin system VapC family toxin [Treponemataceae bacterium]
MKKDFLLLDTHIILWMLSGDEKLSQRARKLISENIDSIYYSIASMWETQIKHGRKKLSFSGIDFLHYCEQSGFHKLPIDDLHVAALAGLVRDENAPPHSDPFDRILLSQAKAEGFHFVTHDPLFRGYNENCVIEV